MAYVAEGLGDLVDWDKAAAAYQRKNGSFFNSPATTAAAAIHSNNDRARDYLDTVVAKFDCSGTNYIIMRIIQLLKPAKFESLNSFKGGFYFMKVKNKFLW